MRVVFMGTPSFSAAILEELAQHHQVVAVYTRPDAVRGRGGALGPSPVKETAQRLGLPVFTPKTLRDAETQDALASLAPDVVCVAAYGALLPAEVLSMPKHGCLNVHASLLPRWRGAAPIERAVLAGDAEVGVCIMRMEEGLDTGPYCICRTLAVEGKYADELTDELAALGANALLTALVHVECGADTWTFQDDLAATYAHKVDKGELDLDPAFPAQANARRVQASGRAHASRCVLAGRGVTVERARDVSDDEAALRLAEGLGAGSARFAGKRLFLGCAPGIVEVLELKPDGKKTMDARAFAAGAAALHGHDATWEKKHA